MFGKNIYIYIYEVIKHKTKEGMLNDEGTGTSYIV